MAEGSYAQSDRGQPDWWALVQDVEARVDALSAALNDVHEAVRRLSLIQPYAAAGEPAWPSAMGATAEAAWPSAVAATESAWRDAATGLGQAPPAAESVDEAAVRDEVRRAVEQARADLSRGSGGAVEEAPDASAPPAPSGWGDLRTGMSEPFEMATYPEAARAEVRRAMEQSRVESHAEQAPPGSRVDDEAARDEVRRAVEQARAELQAGYEPPAPEDSDNVRDEVRRAVEQARAELQMGYEPPVEPDVESESVRDDVRRAVEQARAELQSGGLRQRDAPEQPPQRPSAQSFMSAESFAERGSPTGWHREEDLQLAAPSIVIEDPTGRVDLACVYETLNRLDCAGHATLQNYTLHSVTVGLSMGVQPPAPEAVAAAVREAFGYGCNVTSNGGRIAVRMTGGSERAA